MDLYRSERSELRRDRDSPTHPIQYVTVMNKFLLGGWVERPNVFYFYAGFLFSVFAWSPSLFLLEWYALRGRLA